ncbi:MAG: hypothetical protein JNK67_17425 [Alphaproteobacteria bacterium]|nr:hypothetical protein [Alphaproteobacteria bacterium]
MAGVNRIAAPLALALTAALAACSATRGIYDDLPRLRLATRIALANMCAGSQSPTIGIANAPAGIARYRVRMSNVTVLWQSPSEWTIAAPTEPGLIPIGALPGYSGPCPGDQQQFSYRFEVLALGGGGQPLGYGITTIRVRSVNDLAQETWRRAARSEPLDPTKPPAFEAEDGEFVMPRRSGDDIFDDRPRDRVGDTPYPFLVR